LLKSNTGVNQDYVALLKLALLPSWQLAAAAAAAAAALQQHAHACSWPVVTIGQSVL
jgi:hypothetical protein